jgi:hypothetical protein
MDNIIQYANKILATKNIRMAIATVRALQDIIKEHATNDPVYYTELNNLAFRIRMLLQPLDKESKRLEYETGLRLHK